MIYDAVEATAPQCLAPGGAESGNVVSNVGRGRSARVAKRILDVVLAGAALVLLTPLMLLITAAVCLTSLGPPLFAQDRIGRGGRVFRCWKFRSMHRDAEAILRRDPELYAKYTANDYKLDCKSDPRVTRVGRVLRETFLDELPQLLNVVLGHMSLVGPRPVVPAEFAQCYGPWMDEYLAVRPGITGPWQINGRHEIRYPERAALDAHYVTTWSLWHDLSILARTPKALLRRTDGEPRGDAAVIPLPSAFADAHHRPEGPAGPEDAGEQIGIVRSAP
jgi:lipopolysaccharide/colanic/teichoic acid biosynthesis glycosyltransferase